MSINTLNTKFKLRRDTLENWTTNNPTIAAGEPILVFDGDNTKIKIGKEPNGSTFNNTEYYGGDWNSLLNKPFYETQIAEVSVPNIIYNQDPIVLEEINAQIALITNNVYSAEDLLRSTYKWQFIENGDVSQETENDLTITEDMLDFEYNPNIIVTANIEEIGSLPVLAVISDLETGIGQYFSSPGTYGLSLEIDPESHVIIKNTSFYCPSIQEIHKLDPKYIDQQQLEISWSNLIDPPFGDITGPSYSIDDIPTDYNDLIQLTPHIDISTFIKDDNSTEAMLYRVGDYIPFNKIENSDIAIELFLQYRNLNESFNDMEVPLELTSSDFHHEDDDSYLLLIEGLNEGIPILFGIPTDNYEMSENVILQAGIYILYFHANFTGENPITEEPGDGDFRYWIKSIKINGETSIKPIDAKYLTEIDYSQIKNTLVNTRYYGLQNSQTLQFPYSGSQDLYTNDIYYSAYTANLSEAELLTSDFFDNNGNGKDLTQASSSECLIDRITSSDSEALIYYLYLDQTKSEYADAIYVSYKSLDENNFNSISYNIYDKNNNSLGSSSTSSNKLYLLRWSDNSITHGIISIQTYHHSGSFVKKLHPCFLPSSIMNNTQKDNGICKWIDGNTIFTPSNIYGSTDYPLEGNYYTINKNQKCNTGMSDYNIVVNNKDVTNGNYAHVRFDITVNQPETLYITADNYKTINNYGRIAIGKLDTSLDYSDLTNVYVNADYDTVFSGSPPSFNVTKGTHYIDVIIYSTDEIEDDTDYIDFYLSPKTLQYVTTLSDYLSEQINLTESNIPNLPASKITSGTLDLGRIPDLPASKITSGTFDSDRLPDNAVIYDFNQNNIDINDFIIIAENSSYNTKYKYYRIENLQYADLYNSYFYYYYRYHTDSWNILNQNLTSNNITETTFDDKTIFSYSDSRLNIPVLVDPRGYFGGDPNDPTTGTPSFSINNNNNQINVWANYKSGVYILENFLSFNITKVGKTIELPTWERIQNKPFKDFISTIYNQPDTSISPIQMEYNNFTNYYQKLTNYVSKEQLSFSHIVTSNNNETVYGYIRNPDIKTDIYYNTAYYYVDDFIYPQGNPGIPLIISTPNTIVLNGTTFTAGTWILLFGQGIFDHTNLQLVTMSPEIQTLDEKYISDSVKHQLPQTTNNEGAVLRVVNGAWTAVQLPSASGQSF